MHEGAGLQPLGRKQLGQPVERVGIAGVEVQHLAPDLVGLGPLVLFLQGAGVTFPGLDFRGIGLGRSLQMGERLRRPAIGFEDRGEPFVALRIGGKQRQHAAPGFRLAGDVRLGLQRVGQPAPRLVPLGRRLGQPAQMHACAGRIAGGGQ